MTKRFLLLVTFCEVFCQLGHGDTNFVAMLNVNWRSSVATNVIEFVEHELQSHTNDPQRTFARAMVAADLQLWFRGAIKYLLQAEAQISASANYTAAQKAALRNALSGHIQFFVATAEIFEEPTNSVPQTNTTIQTEMFSSCSSNFPYASFLESLGP